VTAKVAIARKGRTRTQETLTPDSSGQFVTAAALRRGETAAITLEDAWGNRTASPAVVSR
jgi:hypothetical protein